jgi:serine/threonine kinase 16
VSDCKNRADDRARINVENRQQALLEQDIASEHSTMPFRAPELFDVKTGRMLDEKVDIWASRRLQQR